MVEGVPQIKWTEKEVSLMNQLEDLEFSVIGKFTSKHILIRLSKQEDYVNLISKGTFYINCRDGYAYLMRTLIND
ncbi:hypothetical protein H5410_016135 [Solanum commersonii]|uniref:Uncharacterized protein n=1 Tax=Solanum commersonii TaxID=4109 RepID=A0A9J5ZWP8_SOLCO|nr:hypothetical protein H5410_016135 [Solanum commersonii]